jgi:hypothetical protein
VTSPGIAWNTPFAMARRHVTSFGKDAKGMAALTPDRVLYAGGADFGSGLLLKLHAAVQAMDDGAVLEVRGAPASVAEDLAAWCVLTGNALVGPLQVRKGGVEVEPEPPELGNRLWLYSNFDCNLACDYCCARSSPRAAARRIPVGLARSAVAEFAADGGRGVMITVASRFSTPTWPRSSRRSPSTCRRPSSPTG